MVDRGIDEGAGSEFFNDQIIHKEDLQNIEYTKIKTIRDTIAACISQPGVAIASLADASLKVVYVDSKHFSVNPGTAIDKFGRIIYVPDDTSVYGNTIDKDYHPAWPDRIGIAHNQNPSVMTRYYVNIYYATQQDIPETDDIGTSHYTRIYDSYRIEVENSEAGSGSFGEDGICLGSFQVNSSGDIVYTIDDFRSVLQTHAQGGISSGSLSARDIYKREASTAPLMRFTTNSPTYVCQEYFAYLHYGQNIMNIQFVVPSYSGDPGTLGIGFNGGAVSGSLSYVCPLPAAKYNFSLDINSLSGGTKYQVQIWLKRDDIELGGGTFVRDVVISVV